MPAYNCGKYISQTIKSILNQTYKEFEFLIIDDGSTDNTENIIRTFKDGRILYKNIDHKGISAALNYGISIASGDWIARIDADDLNTPDRLEKQINFLNCNPEYNVISSWSVYFNDKGRICFLWKPPIDHQNIYRKLDLHNPLNHSGIVFNRDLIIKEKYDETFMNFEDFELFYRIRDKAVFYNIPLFLTYTRLRKDSNTKISESKSIFDLLFKNSSLNLGKSTDISDKKYWNQICGDLCLFYGKPENAKRYYKKILTPKNLVKYLLILVLGDNLEKFLRMDIKFRIYNLFNFDRKYYKFLKEYF